MILSRRALLRWLGTATLVGAAGPLARAGAAEPPHFAPPLRPMVLGYRVRRPLIGEAAILTSREFAIRFVPLTEGYRVEGRQIASSIDSPPDLAPLADVWSKTELAGLFPFMVDADGYVVSGSGPDPAPVPELGEAIDAALAMLRQGGSGEPALADARGFFAWLQQASAQIGADLPRNLFVPPPELRQAARTIELPGGTSGTIEISFQGTLAPDTGVMRAARREIVTRVEGTSRSTVEDWSLKRA